MYFTRIKELMLNTELRKFLENHNIFISYFLGNEWKKILKSVVFCWKLHNQKLFFLLKIYEWITMVLSYPILIYKLIIDYCLPFTWIKMLKFCIIETLKWNKIGRSVVLTTRFVSSQYKRSFSSLWMRNGKCFVCSNVVK